MFLDNKGITNPEINLAIEEYALKNLPIDEAYLLFYINEPSIIIGKNQNTIEEINQNYVDQNNIKVVRRLSGGGAVYHDLGNLNFSFITKDDGNSFHNFRKFTEPVTAALAKLGVNAELSGRNDILVDGRKISGNAQFSTRGRMFNHGTLLFNSEIEHIVSALQVSEEKIASKGIKSIKSRVANISEFLKEEMTIESFRNAILQSIFAGYDEIPTYQWTDEDWQKIKAISKERYQKWDWNYGQSPQFQIQKSQRLAVGKIDVCMNVTSGKIVDCKIFGDFFGASDVIDIENRLLGVRYDREVISEALADVDISHYFGAITKEMFVQLVTGN